MRAGRLRSGPDHGAWHRGRRSARLMFCGVGAAAVIAAAGCGDSVVPPPSGRIDDGGYGGGYAPAAPFGSDVPRSPTNPPIASTNDRATAQGSAGAHGGTAAAGFGGGRSVYELAAEAVPDFLSAGGVVPDTRPEAWIEKVTGGYPAVAAFDLSAAVRVPSPDAAVEYQPIEDPAAEPGETLPAIDLRGPAFSIEAVRFSAPEAARAVVLSKATGSARRLDGYDLKTGEWVAGADLPDAAALLAVSPDGTRAAVRLGFGRGDDRPASSQIRIDVYELDGEAGRHLAGWRPGEASGEAAVPLAADFLDQSRLVTLTADGAVTLWNLSDAKAVWTAETRGRGPLVLTPGRKFLAVFTGTTFAAFEADSGAFRGVLTPPRPTVAACPAAAFSPDGRQLAAVLRRPGQSVVTWDVTNGRPAREADAPLSLGPGLHFGGNGCVVAGGTLFDLAAGRPVWRYESGPLASNVPTSPDRRHWFTAARGAKAQLLAVAAPTPAVEAAASGVETLPPAALQPGDTLAVSFELPGSAIPVADVERPVAGPLARAAADAGLRLSPDGQAKLSIRASERPTGEFLRFDPIGFGATETVPAHEMTYSLELKTADGRTVWTADGKTGSPGFASKREGQSTEQAIVEALWQSLPGHLAALAAGLPAYPRAEPLGKTLGTTRLWLGAGDVVRPGGVVTASVGVSPETDSQAAADAAPVRKPVASFAAQPNGEVLDLDVAREPLGYLITTGNDGGIRIWEPKNLRAVDSIYYREGVTRVALHPIQPRLAYGTADGKVRVYDLQKKATAGQYAGTSGTAITALDFASDGTLYAGDAAGALYRWTEAARGTPAVVARQAVPVTAVAAVPNAGQVVAAWADGTVKKLDPAAAATPLAAAGGPVYSLAVSPDGATALFGTDAGATLVNVADGGQVATLGRLPATAVAYRPDGAQFAVGDRLGRVVLWQSSDRTPESRLIGRFGAVSAIAFSADGRGIAVSNAGSKDVAVYDLTAPPGEQPQPSPPPSRLGGSRFFGPGMHGGP